MCICTLDPKETPSCSVGLVLSEIITDTLICNFSQVVAGCSSGHISDSVSAGWVFAIHITMGTSGMQKVTEGMSNHLALG